MKSILGRLSRPLLIAHRTLRTVKNEPQLMIANFEVLNCYKAVYGNLQVPRTYVINETEVKKLNCKPHFEGFELGKYVKSLELAVNANNCAPDVQHRLTQVGLITHKQILAAAEAFVARKGHSNVPRSFVVPESEDGVAYPATVVGFPLGVVIDKMVNDPLYCAAIREDLQKIGFTLQFNNDLGLAALKTYKEIHGNTQVPRRFFVPSDDPRYPAEAASLRLDIFRNHVIRNLKLAPQEVRGPYEALGVFRDQFRSKFNDLKDALEVYKRLHGNLYIRANFVVPADSEYPRKWWGKRLGLTMSYVRCGRAYTAFRDELLALGVSFIVYRPAFGLDLIYAALRAFKQVHGHLKVAEQYVISPNDLAYPERTRGMQLGREVRKVKSRLQKTTFEVVYADAVSMLPQEKQEAGELLDMVEFVNNHSVNRERRMQVISGAIQAYKAVYGHINVHKTFVIPLEPLPEYPEETRGLPLGQIIRAIRYGALAEFRDKWEELGLSFDKRRVVRLPFSIITQALIAFKEQHGHMLVPTGFIVPVGDAKYPEKSWGLRLGTISQAIRISDTFKQHREQLEQIGFDRDLSLSDAHYQKVYKALVAYKHVHGHLRIPEGFKIPTNDRAYPEETWGLTVARSLAAIRQSGAFSKHRRELEELGVNFTLENKLFFEFPVILSALKTYKQLYGNVNVPVKFVVQDEVFGSEAQGMQLGYVVSSIRLKNTFSEHRAELMEVGIDFTVKKVQKCSIDTIMQCLKIYKKAYGNLNISRNFAIPEGSNIFPEEAWHLKLGVKLQDIRFKGVYKEHRKEFENIGVKLRY